MTFIRSRKPALKTYLLALGLACVAFGCQAALRELAPGLVCFIVLLPAVVISGVFCGTTPAIMAAAAGGLAASALLLRHQLLAPGPLLNAARLELLMYTNVCVIILWATNAMLRMAEAAEIAEARLAEVFRQIPGAATIMEAPSGRVLLASAKSEDVLGHGTLVETSVDDMARYGGLDGEGRPVPVDAYPIVRALKFRETVRSEALRYRRPDGKVIDLEVHAGPVLGADGGVIASVGMAFDVTERREAERRLQESEARYRALAERLHAALQARDVLMHEADHRIKNSLQLVASLLRIQHRKSEEPATRQALGEAMARVDAIANTHRALQSSPDLRTIAIDAMLADLCTRVGLLNPQIDLRCDAATGLGLDAEKAIPLGLIASELLTNALRHAFAPGAPGAVSLRLCREDSRLKMIIADNGMGLPDTVPELGLGSTVVNMLARQIGAEVATESRPGRGVVAELRMELREIKQPAREEEKEDLLF